MRGIVGEIAVGGTVNRGERILTGSIIITIIIISQRRNDLLADRRADQQAEVYMQGIYGAHRSKKALIGFNCPAISAQQRDQVDTLPKY